MFISRKNATILTSALAIILIAGALPNTMMQTSYTQEPPEVGPILVCSEADNGYSADMDPNRSGLDTAIAYIDPVTGHVFLCTFDADAETIRNNDEVNPNPADSVDVTLTELGDAFLAADTNQGGIQVQNCIGSNTVLCPPATSLTSPENCDNGIDDDGDGLVDGADPDCGPQIEGEGNAFSCEDGADNDLDGLIDAQDESSCWPPFFSKEFVSLCGDGEDNDDDGTADYGYTGKFSIPADPDCYIPSESDGIFFQQFCFDGYDNDGDTLVDSDDPDCGPTITASSTTLGSIALTSGSLNPSAVNLLTTSVVPASSKVEEGPSNPQTEAEGLNRYVVWEEENAPHQNEVIKFSVSHENGAPGTFSAAMTLSNSAHEAEFPMIYASTNFVHVIWFQERNIMYTRSDNSGDSFSVPINLSNTGKVKPPIDDEDDDDGRNIRDSNRYTYDLNGDPGSVNVYVTWRDNSKGNGDIYLRNSNDDGASFDPTKNLSKSSVPSRQPDLGAFENLVVDCWTENTLKKSEIFCAYSSNGGDNFGTPVKVSNTPNAKSKQPSADFFDDEVYVGWLEKGMARTVIPNGVFAVAVADSDDGLTYSTPILLNDRADNPDPNKNVVEVQVNQNVAVWDPSGSRG
jgi:hypothetical protein